MCEGFRSFIGMLFLLFVVFPIVAFIWIPYVYNLGQRLNEEAEMYPNYIPALHCAADDAIMIDETTKNRYL